MTEEQLKKFERLDIRIGQATQDLMIGLCCVMIATVGLFMCIYFQALGEFHTGGGQIFFAMCVLGLFLYLLIGPGVRLDRARREKSELRQRIRTEQANNKPSSNNPS